MITFEYDDYIRELEQTAAPYANCISVSRYEDFADMFIDIGESHNPVFRGIERRKKLLLRRII